MSFLTKGIILENTYEILEEIGSGGGGIVFKARHLRLQTDVVVKKIKDEVLGKVKSRQEADILKKLKHPYLPRVYDFIETEDSVYTVMDYIHGENLDEALKKHGKYSQKQVKKWAEQLGEALDYLHSQNPPIIHSDIKPANIMLTKEGNVCLIDFNISLAMGSSMESAVGISAGYSPPEQYRDPALYARITHNYTKQKSVDVIEEEERTELLAEEERTEILEADSGYEATEILADNQEEFSKPETSKYVQYIGKGIDARSDIYSLGVTLYFMMTGIEPSADFEQRIALEDANVSVSEGFALIIDKMMEIAPDDRYKDGGAFLKAVRNCYKLDHRYVLMHRKETLMQIGSLASLALGIVGIFGGLFQMKRETNSKYFDYLGQAQEAMNLYDYEEADKFLEEAKAVSQSKIDAYEDEVYLHYLSGDYEGSIKFGENYINTMPFLLELDEDREQFGNLYYVVGNSYFELGDYVNAKNAFAYAIDYNSKNGLYYRDYAITLAKLGQIEEAERQLENGIKLGITEDSIFMAQGEIAHVKGLYEEALEYLNQTIMLTDDMQIKKRAVLLCVDVYKTLGEKGIDDEIELLEQYRGQFGESNSLVMTEYLADAYTRKAQADGTEADICYQKALELFTSIYEKGYVTYQLQENMAILYENMNEFDRAEAVLLKMAGDYPQRYEVYKRLAYLEADRQQTKENADRDYKAMQEYYEKATDMYSGKEQDMEMDMLGVMMQEIRDGGWLE